jgi:arsenate reductase
MAEASSISGPARAPGSGLPIRCAPTCCDGQGRWRSNGRRCSTIQLLGSLGYETSSRRSKSWAEFARPGAPALDFVFTVCDNAAGETCPVWPGQPMTAHWGVPDPAEAQGSAAEIALAFKDAYRMLHQRIGIFIALPIASLDHLSLQRRLGDIGRLEGKPRNHAL